MNRGKWFGALAVANFWVSSTSSVCVTGVTFSRNSISIISIFLKAYIHIFKSIQEYFIMTIDCEVEWIFLLFSNILDWDNEYSDTLDFRTWWVGDGHVFRFSDPCLEIGNVNILIYIHTCTRMYDMGHRFELIFMKFTW